MYVSALCDEVWFDLNCRFDLNAPFDLISRSIWFTSWLQSPIITWVMSGEDEGDGGDDAGHQVTPFPRYTATVVGVFQDHVQ